jgi:photosystem II stability/assembly factor-like uncharacterized protein
MKKCLITALLTISLAVLSGCSSIPGATSLNSGSIWRSDDNGKTWEVKNQTGAKGILPAVDVLSIAFSPTDGNKILFGTRSNGIIKTDDGGESFESFNWQSEKVYGLLIDPNDENIIYASGVLQKRGKIFKSLDYGKTWKEIYTGAANGPLIIAMALDKNNSQIVYASASDKQIIKTTDGGETWRSLSTGTGPVVKIAMDKNNTSLLYLLTLDGKIFKSNNAGESFDDITKKVSTTQGMNTGFNFLEIDPILGNGIYLGGKAGILRSGDAGETWGKIETLPNPNNFPVTALAVNPANGQEIIAAVAQATYRSVDGGRTWATYQFSYPKSINFLKYSPLNTSTIFLTFKK